MALTKFKTFLEQAPAKDYVPKKDGDEEVEGLEPRSKGERDFKAKHTIKKTGHPAALDKQFKAEEVNEEQIDEISHTTANNVLRKREQQHRDIMVKTYNAVDKPEVRKAQHKVSQAWKSYIKRAPKKRVEEDMAEGLGKDLKRLATGKDVKSRAGQEIAKAQQASMTGDNKTAHKHFKRFDKLDRLTKEEVEQLELDLEEGLFDKFKQGVKDGQAKQLSAKAKEHGLSDAEHKRAMDIHSKDGMVASIKYIKSKSRLSEDVDMFEQMLDEISNLDESMADSWKRVQSMDKGSVTGGKEEARKRLAYLNAVHAHHKKYGNDTKKVKSEIENIKRSRIAEEQFDESEKMGRADYKVSPSGRKVRKFVTFRNDDDAAKKERKDKED
jgi:hypothetical protein